MDDSPGLPQLASRTEESHKGDYGRALLVGGSRGMSGAIALAGLGALRGGAGVVSLGVPDLCLETVASFDPCYLTASLPCDRLGRLVLAAATRISTLAEQAQCVALGPGLGQSSELTKMAGQLYETLPQTLIVDADGLNALASRPEGLRNPGGPRIITPHPGEFRRLVGVETLSPDAALAKAIEVAAEHQIIVVLKGHQSLITDGQSAVSNQTGNPGMATGGSGDVLTGVIAAFVCQGLDPLSAAQLGTYVHGLAGDLAASDIGQVGMIATDLIDYLPEAVEMATMAE